MRAKLMELVYAARVHADEECDKQEGCSRCPYDAQADMCQNGPIVDHLLANGVVVREKGEWMPVKLTRRTTEYRCPFCGRWERIKQPYCNCGAKMDGGAECDNEM